MNKLHTSLNISHDISDRKKKQSIKMNKLTLIVAFLSAVSCEKTPVLLWSPTRPLGDLPQSYSGHTVQTEGFQDNYLTPLTTDPHHNLVIFLQDKLNLEDFTNHADVYNPNSDGGAFKNVKAAMDEHFSIHLPSVMKPMVAVDAIIKTFPGTVFRVDNSDDLQSLKLSDDKSTLILVTLQPTRGHDESKAFAANDAMIGECLKHLTKRSVKFSALYTAKSSSQANPEVNSGRRMLSEGEVFTNVDSFNGTFVNTTDVMLYLRSVTLNFTNPDGESVGGVFPSDSLDINDTTVENDTTNLVMKLHQENASIELTMETIVQNLSIDWVVMKTTVKVMSVHPDWKELVDKDFNFVFDKNITSQVNFSYHCSQIPGYNVHLTNDTLNYTVQMQIAGFQYQPFTSNNSIFFADPMDCVEFFTAPIWMGLLSTLLLLLILFYGMSMIANITTMDRFDDPKGKTITVTVNE